MTEATGTGRGSRVGCVIVNYRSPADMLEQCLASVLETGLDAPARVALVDNGSGDGVAAELAGRYPAVQLVPMGRNAGFAAAVNRGLAELDEPYVLMLNTDAVLEPGALAAMVDALEAAGGDCAGVAPKMMLSAHENVIDAVGTVMPPDGASFNRGIGQCDLGQYDGEDDVFGVCFGAALLRRELFEPGGVGPLYEGYFLYFEDSDWCMRARAEGYFFRTAPRGVVQHLHSGVARHEALGFKYGLIELNTMKLVIRTFESRRLAAGIVAKRSARLLARTFIRRRFIRENLSTLGKLAVGLPALLRERRALAGRRAIPDRRIFELAAGEDAYFDTVEYVPQRCVESLIDSYRRLGRQGAGAPAGAFLAILDRLRREGDSGVMPQLTAADREVISGQPECVQRLVERALAPR
ncbi:MAG: glycosyltransferase family 2 protein [Gaiellales bacterium]|nr:MAG: glycosyltransferase family 2 protein [Gaiellales bacterium]